MALFQTCSYSSIDSTLQSPAKVITLKVPAFGLSIQGFPLLLFHVKECIADGACKIQVP